MNLDRSLLKNIKVLYIEDDPEVLQQMSFFLKKRVGKLIIGQNGKEGFQLFKEHLPDIVLSDLNMPIMDGMCMIREIRRVSDVPIIISTAYSDKEVILKMVDLGIDNYLVKPIDVRQLMEVIEKTSAKILKKRGNILLLRDKALSSEEKLLLEEDIKNAIARFIKEKTGKGPENVKSFIYGDKLEVEIKNSFTKFEKVLAEKEKNISMVKYNREIFYRDMEKDFVNIITEIIEGNFKLASVEIDVKKDNHFLEFLFI
ncbi:Na-translocating system protein MpsC family protein [Alkaliphilus transvaalensis]|uniref:Na-translocating system protein MpsC family protein n=1 Tax=Alkaliphilus transvaalensis TaxID=114628 RepID=UPI0006879F30|nr:Na-translocating system protein MpsC family protein [Alkaliphilus transvaalensis]